VAPLSKKTKIRRTQIENLDYNIDMSNWCNMISYTIWNNEEVLNGDMWQHLRTIK